MEVEPAGLADGAERSGADLGSEVRGVTEAGAEV